MKSLNLRECPPRPPREMLAGLVFTPRVIDKIRASLPGGELNGYFTDIGMSVAWSRYTGVDLIELHGVVAHAATEDDVEAWIAERTQHLDKAKINAALQRIDTSRIPDEWREAFDRAYPLELQQKYPVIFDLLEADDARLAALERAAGVTPDGR